MEKVPLNYFIVTLVFSSGLMTKYCMFTLLFTLRLLKVFIQSFNICISRSVTSVVNICLEENNPVERTNIKDGMESSGSLEQLGAWNAGGEFPLLAVVQKLQHQGIDFSRLKVRSQGWGSRFGIWIRFFWTTYVWIGNRQDAPSLKPLKTFLILKTWKRSSLSSLSR